MYKRNKYIVLIDFDSTFVAIESLDKLAEIVLQTKPNKEEILSQIVEITKQGMEGRITFPQSLTRRLKLFGPNKKHIDELILCLQKAITPSFQRNKNFFKKNVENIYILSGGFKDYMIPVLKDFGITEDHILGNTFFFDKQGKVVGYDKNNPLGKEKGKVKMIEQMNFAKPLIIVGDGFTDYEIKQAGLAHIFIAFIENVVREAVIKNADMVANNFEEVLENL